MDKSSSEKQLNVNSEYIIGTLHGNLLRRLLSLPSQSLRNDISFKSPFPLYMLVFGIGQLKRDDTRAETRFCLSVKRTSPFKSAGEGGQFSRLLAGEVCVLAVVMLDTPCSEVV